MSYEAQLVIVIALVVALKCGMIPLLWHIQLRRIRRDEAQFISDMQNRRAK